MQAKLDRRIVRFIRETNETSKQTSIRIPRQFMDSFQWADILPQLDRVKTIYIQIDRLKSRHVELSIHGSVCTVILENGYSLKKAPAFLYDSRIVSIRTCNLRMIVPNPNVTVYEYHTCLNLNYNKLKQARHVVKHAREFKLCLSIYFTNLEEMSILVVFCLEYDIQLQLKFHAKRTLPKYVPGIQGDFVYTKMPLCVKILNAGTVRSQVAHLFYTLHAYPDVLEEIVHLLTNG